MKDSFRFEFETQPTSSEDTDVQICINFVKEVHQLEIYETVCLSLCISLEITCCFVKFWCEISAFSSSHIVQRSFKETIGQWWLDHLNKEVH